MRPERSRPESRPHQAQLRRHHSQSRPHQAQLRPTRGFMDDPARRIPLAWIGSLSVKSASSAVSPSVLSVRSVVTLFFLQS